MSVGQWYGFSQVCVRPSCVYLFPHTMHPNGFSPDVFQAYWNIWNRLATEFFKLWSFISLSMKCESVFLTKKKRKRKSDCKCICEANYQPCVELL